MTEGVVLESGRHKGDQLLVDHGAKMEWKNMSPVHGKLITADLSRDDHTS